jgi:hypothetical protein
VNIPFSVCRTDETLNEPVRHRLRLSSAHQQAVNAEGAVDTVPAVSRPIKDCEDVPREQRGRDSFNLPRVSTIFPVARYKGSKALIGKLLGRVKLTLRQSADYVPARLAPENRATGSTITRAHRFFFNSHN